MFAQETITRGLVACLNIPGRVATLVTVSYRAERWSSFIQVTGFRSQIRERFDCECLSADLAAGYTQRPPTSTVLSVMIIVAFKVTNDVVDKSMKKSLKFCAGKHPASYYTRFHDTTISLKSYINKLRQIDLLLCNDHEIRNYTTSVSK